MPIKGPRDDLVIPLTSHEYELVEAYAEMHGLTVDEAASKLASDCIARRIRRNTGKSRAKVYPIKR